MISQYTELSGNNIEDKNADRREKQQDKKSLNRKKKFSA